MKKPNTHQAALFFACLLAYTCAYLSRDTFSAMMPNLLSNTQVLKTDLGLISTIFLVFYGAGQFINGILGDRFPAHRLIILGLAISALVNFSFAFTSTALQMEVLWGINGFALSMLWAPIVKVLTLYTTGAFRKRALVNISISMPLGSILAFASSAMFSKFANFRLAFQSVGLMIGLVAVFFCLVVYRVLPTLQIQTEQTPASTAASGQALSHVFILSGLAIITIAIMCNGIIRNGVSIWVPTYLTEYFQLEEFVSILSATVIPIVNLGGIYVVTYVNRRTKNEMTASALFFLLSACAMGLLVFLGSASPVLAILLLAITTASMQGVSSILMSFIPLGFESYGKVSTVTGYLNASAYLASSVGSYAVGIISTVYGWNPTIFFWVLVGGIGFMASAIVISRWRNFLSMHAS